jgi:hypothetical protein
MLVFTNAQTISFFEAPTQMAIPADTRLQLQTEGIDTVDDLSEFDDDNLKQISENLHRPSGRVPANPAHPDGLTISTPPFVFGAKSLNRLKAASAIVRYYETIGRAPTIANMQWDPVMKVFAGHWKSLQERKLEDNPKTPKISKSLPIVKWPEAFFDVLNRVIGTRTISSEGAFLWGME